MGCEVASDVTLVVFTHWRNTGFRVASNRCSLLGTVAALALDPHVAAAFCVLRTRAHRFLFSTRFRGSRRQGDCWLPSDFSAANSIGAGKAKASLHPGACEQADLVGACVFDQAKSYLF